MQIIKCIKQIREEPAHTKTFNVDKPQYGRKTHWTLSTKNFH